MSRLATKAELTAIENKIPYVSKFATKTALTSLRNTVPDISTLTLICMKYFCNVFA